MSGRGRMGEHDLGPGGFCVCSKCGYKVEHNSGKPCRDISCPKCRVPLEREGAPHDQKI